MIRVDTILPDWRTDTVASAPLAATTSGMSTVALSSDMDEAGTLRTKAARRPPGRRGVGAIPGAAASVGPPPLTAAPTGRVCGPAPSPRTGASRRAPRAPDSAAVAGRTD